jgi:hypothetical protein
MNRSKILTMLVAVSALVLTSAVTPRRPDGAEDGTAGGGRGNWGWHRRRLGAGRGSGESQLRVWLPLLLWCLRIWRWLRLSETRKCAAPLLRLSSKSCRSRA